MAFLTAMFAEVAKSGLAHGEAGYWDEIILYGGVALVFIFIVVFAIFKSQQSKPDLEDEKPPDEKPKAG